jgi:hypothetical protein
VSDPIALAAGMGRAVAEWRMQDTATVQVIVGRTTNAETGVVTPLYSTVYTGKCRVQSLHPQESTPETGGATVTVQRYRIDVPVGSFRPSVGQIITITAARLDPHLVGRKYAVVALLHKTDATAYRLAVEES